MIEKGRKSHIFITGATGFVGSSLIKELLTQNYHTSVAVRDNTSVVPFGVTKFNVGNLTADIDWLSMLNGIDVIIHAAARVHIMDELVDDPLAEFRKVNVYATLNLAKQAAKAGAKRFIFISSVKVNGEMTSRNHSFKPDDNYIPIDPYGLSKYEAEQGLLALAKETGMEMVIIRPPLVYGPDVRANFVSMMKWISKKIPLPFGAIHNQRSLIALDNLVSFIIQCIEHPKAANEIFLISDGEDVSTTALLQKVSKALGGKSWLIPVPVRWMSFSAKLIGKEDVANRLFGSLQVDSSKARYLLGWKPVITMDEQLKKTADAYLENEKNL